MPFTIIKGYTFNPCHIRYLIKQIISYNPYDFSHYIPYITELYSNGALPNPIYIDSSYLNAFIRS